MPGFNKKIWILAGVLSFIATLLVYQYLSGLEKPNEENLAPVYVAVQDIPARSVIVKEMVAVQKVPPEYIHPLAATRLEDIVGKTADETILANEQIIMTRLAEENTSKLSYKIPEGKRAVTISANEIILVGNLVHPGDFVDVLVTLEAETVEEGNQTIQYLHSTKTILQNIQVLAVGPNMYNHNSNAQEIPKSITLAVTPVEAEQLVLAEVMGNIRLALRPVLDQEKAETPGAVRRDISAGKAKTIRNHQ